MFSILAWLAELWMSRSWRYCWFKIAHVTVICALLRKNVQVILSVPRTKVKIFSEISDNLFFKALDKGSQRRTKSRESFLPSGSSKTRGRRASQKVTRRALSSAFLHLHLYLPICIYIHVCLYLHTRVQSHLLK